MCNERNILFFILQQQMKYTLSKAKIKEHHEDTFLFSIFFYICFNRNTRLQHSAWWDCDEFINHLKYIVEPGRKQPPVFYNNSCSDAQTIILKLMFQDENINIISKIVKKSYNSHIYNLSLMFYYKFLWFY